MHFWIVCYDIRDDKRLRRVAKCMLQFGDRVQKSVFECWLDKNDFHNMLKEVKALIEPEDNFRCYRLCDKCRSITEKESRTEINKIEKYYIV